MKHFSLYIIVDDDPVNNTICRMIIQKGLGNVHIKDFTDPLKGLEYIQMEYADSSAPTVLFLDINMPTITGWEFLEYFEKLEEKIKDQFIIYILSSSVNNSDRDKARANKNVIGYISKPLTQELVLAIDSGQLKDDY